MTDLASRYAQADSLLSDRMKTLILPARVGANWLGDTETFWCNSRWVNR